jgi:hypothetical protein
MRRAVKLAITAACAIGVALGGSSISAKADTTINSGNQAWVTQDTAAGAGIASVTWSDPGANTILSSKNTPAYAYANIDNDFSGYSMAGWLERSTNGGATWSVVSGVHYLNSGNTYTEALTDAYYDGPGYLARACFQFTSWSGAAVHCSPGI